jgi:hypothetical protein
MSPSSRQSLNASTGDAPAAQPDASARIDARSASIERWHGICLGHLHNAQGESMSIITRSSRPSTHATTRAHALFVPAFLIALVLGDVAAHAAVTIGLEWELQDVALTAYTYAPTTNTVTWTDPRNARPETMMCSQATAAVGGTTFPLVKITYDLGNTVRTLEVVTAPLAYNSAGDWTRVLRFVQKFLVHSRTGCQPVGDRCVKSLSLILAAMNAEPDPLFHMVDNTAATHWPCGATPHEQGLAYNASGAVLWDKTAMPNVYYDVSTMDWNGVNPQVNIGVKLSDLWTQNLAPWFGNSTGRTAYTMVKNWIAGDGVNALLDDDAKGFLLLYAMGINVETNKFYANLDSFHVKNDFGLYPKSPFNAIYRQLATTPPAPPRTLTQQEYVRQMLQQTNIINTHWCIPLGAPPAPRCTGFHYNITPTIVANTGNIIAQFYSDIVTNNQDPVGIAKPAGPLVVNGQRVVVMEVRNSVGPNVSANLRWVTTAPPAGQPGGGGNGTTGPGLQFVNWGQLQTQIGSLTQY